MNNPVLLAREWKQKRDDRPKEHEMSFLSHKTYRYEKGSRSSPYRISTNFIAGGLLSSRARFLFKLATGY